VRSLFDIERTAETYALYFDEHADVLRELLHSVARSLARTLPPDAGRKVDREGARLVQEPDGGLRVARHPVLEAALSDLTALGLFRVFAPPEHGGFGLPVALYYLAVQLISEVDSSLALTFLVHGNALYVILRYGSDEQKRRYLPDMVSGARLASVAFTEPWAGSDAGGIRTKAERDGDSWVLTGSKLFITHGGDADILVTTARTGPPEQGIHGVSTFIVERQADGVEVLGLEHKTAQGGSPTAALNLPSVRIPTNRQLGQLNAGGAVMFAGVGMTRVNIGAQALGIAKRAFAAAVTFALERRQGGCLIVEHDAIQQRLADIAFMVSATESLICHVSRLEHAREWHVREMSITKYYTSEALQEVTLRAINVHGGYGVSTDYEVERCRREAVSLPLYGGTSEIQWLIIAREYLEALAGTARADYRRRDEHLVAELRQSCAEGLTPLVDRLERGSALVWSLAGQLEHLEDAAPYYRHIADLAVAWTVALVLLQRTAANGRDAELDHELAQVAVERLEDQAASSERHVSGRRDGARLKRALRSRLS
jgi:hypothetical protein